MSGTPERLHIKHLSTLTKQNLAKKLDIREDEIGGDFKTLGAHLGMDDDNLASICQGKQPTEKLLRWWGRKSEATIPKLRRIFQKMGRPDCVDILNEDPAAGTVELQLVRSPTGRL